MTHHEQQNNPDRDSQRCQNPTCQPNQCPPNQYGPNQYGPNQYGPNQYGPNQYGQSQYNRYPGYSSGYGSRPWDELDAFLWGMPSVMEQEMDRMQRQMMGGMRNMSGSQTQRGPGPFDTPFFNERSMQEMSGPNSAEMSRGYWDQSRLMDPFFSNDMWRSPMDSMRRSGHPMFGPWSNFFQNPFGSSYAPYALSMPPQGSYDRPWNSQSQLAQPPMHPAQQSGMDTARPGSSDPNSSRGRWVTETMEGIFDGDNEPIFKKTRSSFNTDSGVLKRETQKRIGDKTLNVLKTKKIAHPSEMSQNLTWDSETRSRPKNDAFTAEWKEAKKKLTQGQNPPQHPPANTHKALFHNMNQPSINPPKTSP